MNIFFKLLKISLCSAFMMICNQFPAAAASANEKPCYACHPSKLTKKVPHPPVAEKDCKACHKSEGGNHQLQKGLYGVKKQGASICYDCHDAEMAKGKSVHAPVSDNDCVSCHDPHGGSRARFLKGNYPAASEAAFSEDGYSLCLSCHEPKAFTDDETGSATGFRDGKTNLHALHVKGAALTCKACHNVHAAPQQKLLSNASKNKNGVEILLNMTFSASGGSCKMTCHSPATYNR
ncbi:doubled CXXCH motif protein [Geobacter sp. OR-1]|nr:doubled CXXCH motif protein [Geobacter sp. OR-1]